MVLHVYTADVSGRIKIAWDSSVGATGYRVYYGVASGVYTSFVDVGNVLVYTLTGLVSNQLYYLAIRSYDGSGNLSGYSAEVSSIAYPPIIVRGSAATATSHRFAYIPTGSMTSGGSALKSRKRVYTASGGIQAGGSAVSLSQGGGRFVYTGSGGIVTGGGSTWNRTRVYTASGGSIVTGGAASVLASLRTIYNYTPSGRIDLSGSAPVSAKHNSTPTGQAIIGGAASVQFIPATPAFTYSYAASGGITTTGSSPHRSTHAPIASGSIVIRGSANSQFIAAAAPSLFSYTGNGIIQIGGSASKTVKHAPVASGGMAIIGSAPVSHTTAVPAPRRYAYVATGSMEITGDAGHFRILIRPIGTDFSGVRMGGAASAVLRSFSLGSTVYQPTAGGEILMSGSADVAITTGYFPDGGIVMGGGATAILIPAELALINLRSFRLYKRDCEVRVKEWGSGESAYAVTNPFGGPHHDEPTGAAI